MNDQPINQECCDGLEKLTPMSTANPPGLDSLVYRVGVHATFLETMKARLTDMSLADKPQDAEAMLNAMVSETRALTGLNTRDADDPSIALLDAWATVADVLTFYQERIANEGYLRTATERRSLVELARLMGYQPRPGVASSVYLAFTVEDGYNKGLYLPKGARANTTPGPGETQQTFETASALEVRTDWNNLAPRTTVVQTQITAIPGKNWEVYLQGISTNLKVGDPILTLSLSGNELWRVTNVLPDNEANITTVSLQNWNSPTLTPPAVVSPAMLGQAAATTGSTRTLDLGKLAAPPTPQLAGSAFLARGVDTSFAANSDLAGKLLTALNPALASNLYAAWRNQATDTIPLKVYALRAKASPFGATAPLEPVFSTIQGKEGVIDHFKEWDLVIHNQAVIENFDLSLRFFESDGVMAGGNADITVLGGTTISLSADDEKLTNTANILTTTFKLVSEDPNEKEVATVTVKLDRIQPPVGAVASNWGVTEVSILFNERQVNFTAEIDAQSQDTSAARVQVKSLKDVVAEMNTVVINRDSLPVMEIDGTFIAKSDTPTESPPIIWLEAPNSQVIPDSWVAIQRPEANGFKPPIISQVTSVMDGSRANYGISSKSTRIELKQNWVDPAKENLSVIRNATVYSQSEELPLAEVPVTLDIEGGIIDLENLYNGLQAGRWIIITGERTDIPNTEGVTGTELAMIALVSQGTAADVGRESGSGHISPVGEIGEKMSRYEQPHTTLILARPLAYTYKPDTTIIYGNVAEATHGETRKETLGAGSGSQVNQTFTLKQKPLTFTPASTTSGVETSLQVYVNDILWHEAASIIDLGPRDRSYVTSTDNDQNTSVIFGDGKRGARLPTGTENVRAVYRNGIGVPGNVRATTINVLATKPQGVKGVVNPLAATGGADPESRDRIRSNLPLAARSLGRLISVRDYEDYARIFAGIGKASATQLSNGRRQVIHITIAGEADIPISTDSLLYSSLLKSLREHGDPNTPVIIANRELLSLVIAANVKRNSDYLWENVSAAVSAALLDAFSFDRRDLGQDVALSEILSVIQEVPGVDYVDLDTFAAVSEANATAAFLGNADSILPSPDDPTATRAKGKKGGTNVSRIPVELAHPDPKSGELLPAQLVYLRADVPETLILNEVTS